MRNNLQWHPATVRERRDLTSSVREFELRPAGGVVPWTVGSHLNVQVRVAGREETRSYSLVGLPPRRDEPQVYRIAVKRADPGRGGSRYLWSLENGAELLVGEPNNHFELPLSASDYLLVAGGIGITALAGMAQLLARRGAPMRLLYGARNPAEFAYRAALQAMLGDRLQTFASDAGRRIDIEAAIAALHPQGLLLVCGPMRLLEAVQAAWAASGRPPAHLRFETFGNSGARRNEAFTVKLPRHGIELTVPAERTLLDVLEEAGIETLYDCRRGECGLCAMDIVAIEGKIDHRDVFFSPAEKQADSRLCACVSRVSRPGGGGCVVLETAYRPDGH